MGKQEHSSKPAESTWGATSPTNNLSSTTLRQSNPNEQVPSASDVHHSMKRQNTAHDMYSAHGSHFLSLAGHPASARVTPHATALTPCRHKAHSDPTSYPASVPPTGKSRTLQHRESASTEAAHTILLYRSTADHVGTHLASNATVQHCMHM